STESGDGAAARSTGPEVIVRRDPFAVLEDRNLHGASLRRALMDANLSAMEGRDLGGADNERHFERILRRHADDTRWAANLLGRSRPEYETGFAKLMTGQDHALDPEERAAMAVGTAANGGTLVPTHLDPTLIITNSGTSNVIRGVSRVVTLTTGNVWHGATTAGVTASWDGELAEVSDDSPTVGAVSVPTYKAQSFVQASIEAFQDIAGLTSDVLMLFADARDRLEGAAHATGTGSQPKGVFTAVAASASLATTATTAGAIGLADVHALYRSLPVRWRRNGTWLLNPLYNLAIKALGSAVSASYTTDLTQAPSDRILNRPVVESDDAPTVTGTAAGAEVIYGDFSSYLIVDQPGGFSVEFVPMLFNTANNLPDGRRGWYAYWRTGADVVNLSAFRALINKTS
ncbi:MAG TPA: phage major capsid protein, partial [Armatimonadota bacterium]|nr:phage major capsid protein [Armatimonadota bacterium]